MDSERLVRLQDLLEACILAVEAPLAWLLPERLWGPASRACARVVAVLRGPASRRRRREIELAYAGTKLVRSAEAIDVGVRASVLETRLQLLREHRPGGWRARTRLLGLEHVEKALARRKGAILWLSPLIFADLVASKALHREGLSVTRLGGRSHGFAPVPLSAFGRRVLNPIRLRAENRYVAERVVLPEDGSLGHLRLLERRLAANLPVMIRATQAGHRSLDVPFLGGSLRLATGPPSLALSSGAALLPLFVARSESGAFDVIVEPPLEPSHPGDARRTIEDAVQRYAALLQEQVLRDPTLLRWSIVRLGERDTPLRAPAPAAPGSDAREALLARVGELLRATLELEPGAERLTEETGLLGEGIGLDSIEVLQLVAALEEEFDLTLEDDELAPEHFATLGALVDFLEPRLAA